MRKLVDTTKRLSGKVVTGIGDFSFRMETIPGLLDAYERKTGMRFYPGTLNIQLKELFSFPEKRIRLEKEDYGGTVSVNILPCKINGKKAFILRTDKNEEGKGHHSKTIVEIASDVKLRDYLKINDGDEVEIDLI